MAGLEELLRAALRQGDEQQVRYVRQQHVTENVLEDLANQIYDHALAESEADNENPGWRTYREGIIGWWQRQAGLTDEERDRLYGLRGDLVKRLQARGLVHRDHPRSTLLAVRAPETAPEAASNPPWVRDEILLALDLFVRSGSLGGNPLPGRADERVVELSRRMAALPIHPRHRRAGDFRNPTGVALKLANFRAIDRDVAIARSVPDAESMPKGMARYSAPDRSVFEEFYDDWDRLHTEAQAIVAAGTKYAEAVERPAGEDRPVEEAHVESYEASSATGGSRARHEHLLVQRYKRWMEDRGHVVVSRRYRTPGEARPLLADAFVRSLNLIVEAKAQDNRNSVRLAIGQLLDYRRLEDGEPQMAVLLPHEPHSDHQQLLSSVGIGWIWPRRDREGFADSAAGAFLG